MEIDARVKTIQQLKDYFFIVPDYQREFVWKPEEQVDQLLIDIENEFSTESIDQKGYFIGSIIIVGKNGEFDVIDGQQRLTTIIIALVAFRNILTKYRSEHGLNDKAQEYFSKVKELLYNFDIEADNTRYRIQLQYEDSKDYLEKLIDSETFNGEKTESINRMEGAYTTLYNNFYSYIDQNLNNFLSYLKYFLTKIEIVIIESENLSSALKIFETINQRGVGLNAMDLVKNLIFSEAKEESFSKIKETWKELNVELEKCNEQNPLRFLRYFLMARYHDGVIREDGLYKWIISDEGKRKIDYQQKPLAFAKELLSAAKRYAKLVDSTEKLSDGSDYKYVTHIGFINKYKSRQHLILLLALKEGFSGSDINYLAQQIESFLMISNTMGIQAKTNEQRFATWAKKVRELNNREDLENFVDNTIYKWVSDNFSTFKNSFLNKADWNYHPLYRLRFILGRIDDFIRKECNFPEKGLTYYDKHQIEHILPRTPKDDYIPQNFESRDEYDSYVRKLGNITLIESSINQALNYKNDIRNDWYSDKCSEYERSDVLITKLLNPNYHIGDNTAINRKRQEYRYLFENWEKQAIEKRQEVLFELVLNVWRINGKKAISSKPN
jgi:uncharacterized protein with ParB-like and HNH nuclease domain